MIDNNREGRGMGRESLIEREKKREKLEEKYDLIGGW